MQSGAGLHAKGEIVGQFVDSDGKTRTFVLDAGGFTTIDFPGASSTIATAIDESGNIVGGYRHAAGSDHGFLLPR